MQRIARIALAATIIGALCTGSTVAWSSVTVHGPADLRTADFGWPMDFVRQDQSSLDPPFPHETRFLTPREHPTRVDVWAWALDTVVFGAILGGLAFGARLAWRSRRLRPSRGRA